MLCVIHIFELVNYADIHYKYGGGLHNIHLKIHQIESAELLYSFLTEEQNYYTKIC